jgi:hypothetical protein
LTGVAASKLAGWLIFGAPRWRWDKRAAWGRGHPCRRTLARSRPGWRSRFRGANEYGARSAMRVASVLVVSRFPSSGYFPARPPCQLACSLARCHGEDRAHDDCLCSWRLRLRAWHAAVRRYQFCHGSLSRVLAVGSRVTRRSCVRRGGAGPGRSRPGGLVLAARTATMALDADGGLDSEVNHKCSRLSKCCFQVRRCTHTLHLDLKAWIWDGGGTPLGHGWSRVGHDGAARTRSRPVTARHAQSRRCGFGH